MTTEEACRLSGVTVRQATYWAATGRIPGQPKHPGSGFYRQWTPEQVDRLRKMNYAVLQADEILNSVGLSRGPSVV